MSLGLSKKRGTLGAPFKPERALFSPPPCGFLSFTTLCGRWQGPRVRGRGGKKLGHGSTCAVDSGEGDASVLSVEGRDKNSLHDSEILAPENLRCGFLLASCLTLLTVIVSILIRAMPAPPSGVAACPPRHAPPPASLVPYSCNPASAHVPRVTLPSTAARPRPS